MIFVQKWVRATESFLPQNVIEMDIPKLSRLYIPSKTKYNLQLRGKLSIPLQLTEFYYKATM
nr:hypothetical protein BCU55_19760 [Shewanella sp. 10N.286.48.A6]